MIDFIKFYMLDKESFDFRTERKKVIPLLSKIDNETGEFFEYPKVGKFHNTELRITEKATYIKGSLHKMRNLGFGLGNHNHNNLNLCDNFEALEMLIDQFYVKPTQTKITNLEFGLNIPLEYDPSIFIDNCLMWDFKAPSVIETFSSKGYLKQFKKNDYSLKVYNKGKQYNRKENILRIEVKITSKRKLEDLGIFSLEDLYESESYRRLFEFFIEQFEKLLMVDYLVMRKALREGEIHILKQYTNSHYWLNLQKELSANAFYKRKRKCQEYIRFYSFNKSKQKVRDILIKQFQNNMECNTEIIAA